MLPEKVDLPPRPMRLRYAGRCRSCNQSLEAGAMAVYDRETRTVVCMDCMPIPAPFGMAAAEGTQISEQEFGEQANSKLASDQTQPEVFAGVAGASARREGERRSQKREARIREAHPKIGGLLLALSEDPQSTKAWAVGAAGEEKLGRRLDGIKGEAIHVLHDRLIPGSKANIDHIVVCPSGVFVIDAKKYKGQPSLRVEGGILRARTEKLMVGSRDCTKLVLGAQKQVNRVLTALAKSGLEDVPVTGMLCFVEAEWPLLGGDFATSGIKVLWPKKAVEHIRKPGPIDAATAQHIFRTLATLFPAA